MMMPGQYRTVAFTDVGVPLDEESLRAYFRAHPVYRRTRYVVACSDGELALTEVTTETSEPLFCPVSDVRVLATPAETVMLERPEVDTAVPSQMATIATRDGTGHRCVVVRGRYQHVNFVLDPAPRQIHVLDLAPPWPAKLVDQVERLTDTAEDAISTTAVAQVVDLNDLAATLPAEQYLLPCRGGGVEVAGAETSFLDEIPPVRDWVLVGCARSRAIHDHFYPERAAHLPQVDTCPRVLAWSLPLPDDAGPRARLTKCCLLEEGIEVDGETVVVPWGASLGEVATGLARAAELAGGPREDADGQETP